MLYHVGVHLPLTDDKILRLPVSFQKPKRTHL